MFNLNLFINEWIHQNKRDLNWIKLIKYNADGRKKYRIYTSRYYLISQC